MIRRIFLAVVILLGIQSSVFAEITIKKDYGRDNPVIHIEGNNAIMSVFDENDNLIYMNDTADTGSFEPFSVQVGKTIQTFTVYVDFGDETQSADFILIDPLAPLSSLIEETEKMNEDEKTVFFPDFMKWLGCSDECKYIYENDKNQKDVALAIYSILDGNKEKTEMSEEISQWFLTEKILKSSWADLKYIATDKMKIFENGSVNTKEYNSLTASEQSDVFKKTFLQAENINNKDDLVKYINMYISEEKSSDSSKSSSSGGGGGRVSGYTAATSSVTKPIEILTEKDENNDKDKEKVVFNDMKGAEWASEAIYALLQKDVIKGYDDGTFGPDRAVTRAEFIAMIARLFELKEEIGDVFKDVENGQWYYNYIMAAYNAGIVNGDGDLFWPDRSITREDAAVIIARLMEKKGVILEESGTVNFTDGANISDYARTGVEQLVNKKIISGMPGGYFMPQDTLTRAQAAVILYRCIERQ